jgi:hypothetical protein
VDVLQKFYPAIMQMYDRAATDGDGDPKKFRKRMGDVVGE